MAGIDFLKPGLRLGYLIRGEYYDEAGTRQFLRLCGPRSRVGTISRPDPDSGGGLHHAFAWEARCHGVTIDETLGDLSQSVQAVSDLMLSVDLGSHVALTDPVNTRERQLRRDAIYGRWANHPVAMWWIDLDDEDASQEVFRGRWDRNPSGVTDRFRITAGGGIIGMDERLPGTLYPMTTDDWTDTTQPTGAWWPDTYYVHPYLKGRFRGPVFGEGVAPDSLWVELFPYGFDSGVAVYAHVCAYEGAHVHEVFYESADTGEVIDVLNDVAGGVVQTFYNDDPARGPVGTGVRFSDSLAETYAYNNSDRDLRCWGRVSGHNAGLYPTGPGFKDDPPTGSPVHRMAYILEDLFEDPRFLGLPAAFGVGAISDFIAAQPSTPNADWGNGLCAMPPEAVDEPPLMREAVGGMVLAVGADLIQRYDPAAGELRLFPVWRGPRPGQQPDWTLDETHLKVGDAVGGVAHLDDPDGKYANEILLEPPPHFIAPIQDPDHKIAVERDRQRLHLDPAEQLAPAYNGRARRKVGWPLWAHGSETGLNDAGKYFVNERSQPQRVLEATLNHDALAVQLGEVVKYAIPGTYDAAGHVRGRSIDPEAMTVRLRSYHQVFHEAEKGKDDDD